ncbi:MAG: cytochrome c biogenesis protein ResB [Burkholderiales bacterium]|nr:cytochrome c biogenesis protein ResB [Burkholderiales bacterium]
MNSPDSAQPVAASSESVAIEIESRTDSGGIRLQGGRPSVALAIELLSSMRFAISLLSLIAIAITIGTVLKQNEPMGNYVNQFGPFWYEVFAKIGLYSVYSAWWFLLIAAFLVVSTSLCIIRNAPKMLKDMRSWRENVREKSLRNFGHKHEWQISAPLASVLPNFQQQIVALGYQVKVVEKEGDRLIVAKRGAANKFGYIFAHGAIVIIIIGALLDSDLPIRFQEWRLGKEPYMGAGLISEIAPKHRLDDSNPTFRGNSMIPEGQSSNTVILQQQKGVLIQDLPFSITLKKFNIDFYSTGMPKLFASDVVINDPANHKQFAATIKVNEPLIYRGIAIYQSSFEDGGSKLKLTAHAMVGPNEVKFPVAGDVGGSTPIGTGAAGTAPEFTIEWTGFRPFNVENMSSQDARAVDSHQSMQEKLLNGLDKRTGSAAKNANNKDLKNIGPNLQYKIRDKTGQAREYQNYMQPVQLEGMPVYLSGMRESPNDPFAYLRIPADDAGGVKEWMLLRAALQNPELRQAAATRYAARAMPSNSDSDKLRGQLQESSLKSLAIFAGDGKRNGGYQAVSDFITRLPESERQKGFDIFSKILNGSLWDLWQVARLKQGLPEAVADDKHGHFLQLATAALSDSALYGAPIYLQLDDFTEVKASVFQVSRAPGKTVVYIGCLFLVLGVFAMFYIRERRLWLWLKTNEEGGTQALLALSTQRKTLDFEHEFARLKAQLQQKA